MPRPERRQSVRPALFRAAVEPLDGAELGPRRGEVDLRADIRGPSPQDRPQRLDHVVPLRIVAPEVLVVEDQPHARPLVDPQHVRGAEAQIVMLEHQPSAYRLRQPLPGSRPARSAPLEVPVDATDMGDDHGLGPLLHAVEHVGLRGEILGAFPCQLRIGAVEEHILGRVEGQANSKAPRLRPDEPESLSLSATMPWNWGMVGWVA